MTSINSLTNRIFSLYDANRDGAITLKGGRAEVDRLERSYESFPDRDVITLSRYSHAKLFQSADVNNDGQVTKAELGAAIKLFDTNNDDKLTNSGPFWNRKGEMRNFDKAYPESWQVLDRHVIYKPQPVVPPHYPNIPNIPPRGSAVATTAVGLKVSAA
jgi:hypothetical protein